MKKAISKKIIEKDKEMRDISFQLINTTFQNEKSGLYETIKGEKEKKLLELKKYRADKKFRMTN